MEKTPSPLDSICAAFNLFHDGAIELASLDAGRLCFRVDIQYIAERVKPGFTFFTVEISGFRDAAFEAWLAEHGKGNECITRLDRIFALELGILSAEVKDDGVAVVCDIPEWQADGAYCGGTLFFRADSIRIFDEGGVARSMDELGELCRKYWNDWEERNSMRGASSTIPAAQDHAAALYQLSNPHTGPMDESRRNFLTRSAELGHAEAQRDLGCFHALGENGFPKDDLLARLWYGRAAAQGHAEAQYDYGLMVRLGEGGPADPEAGLAWIRQAAAQGDSGAIHFLRQI